jgi:hypothetical protein
MLSIAGRRHTAFMEMGMMIVSSRASPDYEAIYRPILVQSPAGKFA